ncbi:hypothetical protein CCR75_004610 [Bremia lactucae]|uniref:BZIP domain-containing protein n=1 Tax=Bremia lactucae TaxID=4779 RepID=A0A976ILT2_BRELC|nr:hypothetical protein CCR75_004610 [Bremia lactucae]
MAAAYQLATERPHITLSSRRDVTGIDTLQTPITTFTELLNAAQTVETNTHKKNATALLDNSVIRRRLRNRVSCRKTRLKRKLQQHALEVVARERQERHEYLTHLVQMLGINGSTQGAQKCSSKFRDQLYRELAAKSLHYSLVDPNYLGWNEGDITTAHTDMKQDFDAAASHSTRRLKRQRQTRDKDSSAALQSSVVPQTSLVEQWRSIVDGLQNVVFTLDRMQEHEVETGVFQRHCYWNFVALNSARVQQDGVIAAVAVSGVTRLQFYGRHVKEVKVSTVERVYNVPFDLAATPTPTPRSARTRDAITVEYNQ